MNKNFLFALFVILSIFTVHTYHTNTYELNSMMDESENINDYQVDKNNLYETKQETKQDEDHVEDNDEDTENYDKPESDEMNEEVSFDTYKLTGYTCNLSKFDKNEMQCSKQFGSSKSVFRKVIECPRVYSYSKSIGEGKKVKYTVTYCKISRTSVSYLKSQVETEYCQRNPQNCQLQADGYIHLKKGNSNINDDFFMNVLKLDLVAKMKEAEAKLRKALLLDTPLPKFTCNMTTGSIRTAVNNARANTVSNVPRKVCQKRFGHNGPDVVCKRLFSGQFSETNQTRWVTYKSYFCLPKSQINNLISAVQTLKVNVVDQYCAKYPAECTKRRNNKKYLRNVDTLANYQTYVLTAEPAYNATAAVQNKKYRYGGKYRSNRIKGSKFKSIMITFPLVLDGKNTTVQREVKIDLSTGQYYLVPSTTAEGQKQDPQVQAQIESNPKTASFISAEVTKNSSTTKVLSFAVIFISFLIFSF